MPAVPRRQSAPQTAKKTGIGIDASRRLAQAFSNIELLAAADVIQSAISEGRRHVDLDALKSVLAKLTAAYERKKR